MAEPWDAPGEYADVYDPQETPQPICAAEPGDWVPEAAAEWQRCLREPAMEAGDVARLRANYYGKISLIDAWVGRILEAAGVQVPDRCMGQSLWPLLNGAVDAPTFRDTAFSEVYCTPAWPGYERMPQCEYRRNFMALTSRFKYAASEAGEGYMLYDLEEDPEEQNNLISHPDWRVVEEDMRERLLRFLVGKHAVLKS